MKYYVIFSDTNTAKPLLCCNWDEAKDYRGKNNCTCRSFKNRQQAKEFCNEKHKNWLENEDVNHLLVRKKSKNLITSETINKVKQIHETSRALTEGNKGLSVGYLVKQLGIKIYKTFII